MKAYAVVLVLLCVFANVGTARAQRIEVTPFVGWETAGSYPLTNSTDFQALRADANKTFGVAFDYLLTNNIQAEFLWADNPTTYSGQSLTTGEYSQAFTSHINQYQFGALYLFGDNQTTLRPYIVGSIGFTHDGDGGGNLARTALGF